MVERVTAVIIHTLASIFSSLWQRLVDLDELFTQVSGINGRYAIYIIIAALTLILLMHLLKLSFSILQKIVLPAALLSWVAGSFLHMPFFALFTVLVGLGSAWILFKP